MSTYVDVCFIFFTHTEVDSDCCLASVLYSMITFIVFYVRKNASIIIIPSYY